MIFVLIVLTPTTSSAITGSPKKRNYDHDLQHKGKPASTTCTHVSPSQFYVHKLHGIWLRIFPKFKKYACSCHASAAALHYLSKRRWTSSWNWSESATVCSKFIYFIIISTEPVLHVLTNSIRLFRKSVRTGTGLNFFEFCSAIGGGSCGGAAWTRRLFFRLQFSLDQVSNLTSKHLTIEWKGRWSTSKHFNIWRHQSLSLQVETQVGWTFKLEAPRFHIWNWLGMPSEVRLYLNRAATLLYSTYYLMSYMPYKRPTLPVIVSVLTATNSYTVHRLTLSWVACVTREMAVPLHSVSVKYTVRST